MDRKRTNIAVIEPSHIVYEGLMNILLRSGNHFFIYRLNGLDELQALHEKEGIHVAIVNPGMILNRVGAFRKMKSSLHEIIWVGLVYSIFEPELLAVFDSMVSISDEPEKMIRQFNRFSGTVKNRSDRKEQLTDRETDVLILLTKGFYNKEIADKLSISIHTVISHRKNINEKTGIKSLSGLTVYALSKKIVSLDDITF
ncbi:MAG: LuxR C-terminal-related transcriptional regulator [Bacteroidales bacterium]|nr:LuxR C-terminal-related transcriptional regulator [Bacteroidales bacterium]